MPYHNVLEYVDKHPALAALMGFLIMTLAFFFRPPLGFFLFVTLALFFGFQLLVVGLTLQFLPPRCVLAASCAYARSCRQRPQLRWPPTT